MTSGDSETSGGPAVSADGESALLAGLAMVPLVRAVAALGQVGLDRYAIVGGVAVAVRLGRSHRATADVDTVVIETTSPPDAVEAILELPEAEPYRDGENKVMVEGTKVEIIPVRPLGPGELDGVPDGDALFVASHAWALETATTVTVSSLEDRAVTATAPFATPAALVAMKLHALGDRRGDSAVKRAGDAWDIYRLLVDLDGAGAVRSALAAGPAELRRLARKSAAQFFAAEANRTRSWLLQGDDAMGSVTADELRYVAAPLIAALT